jgi:LytS/YehU family sensor histidine kinase
MVLGGLVWLFVGWRFLVYKKNETERNRINQLLNTYQLSALQAQMNPHFIFNAINSIQQFILTNESEAAYRYLTRFSQLVRKVMNQSSKSTHSLSQEMEIIDIYVQLEQLRFQNRFDYIVNVDPDLALNEIEVPTLLLQPYVENAIWHGLMPLPTEQKGLIRLSIVQKDLNIVITISDNGIGRQAAKAHKREGHESKGMGLNQKRIDLQNILLPHIHWSVDIKDAPNGGTEVVLTLSF